jgi:hypothetical protein
MLVEPVVVVVVPVGHSVADVAAVVLTYDPIGARRQLAWPVFGW